MMFIMNNQESPTATGSHHHRRQTDQHTIINQVITKKDIIEVLIRMLFHNTKGRRPISTEDLRITIRDTTNGRNPYYSDTKRRERDRRLGFTQPDRPRSTESKWQYDRDNSDIDTYKSYYANRNREYSDLRDQNRKKHPNSRETRNESKQSYGHGRDPYPTAAVFGEGIRISMNKDSNTKYPPPPLGKVPDLYVELKKTCKPLTGRADLVGSSFFFPKMKEG